jgi:protein-arginine kinase activator protein McsA
MTVKELREIAMTIPNLTGVHAMKKAELLEIIKKEKGIEGESKPAKKAHKGKHPELLTVADIKKKMEEIRAKLRGAMEAKDKKLVKIYRRRINRLKKRSRKLSGSA